jgi:hypothetical protein
MAFNIPQDVIFQMTELFISKSMAMIYLQILLFSLEHYAKEILKMGATF